MRKAINIAWDVDNAEDLNNLPTSIDIPDEIDVEDIGNYISDKIGYVFYGFELTY